MKNLNYSLDFRIPLLTALLVIKKYEDVKSLLRQFRAENIPQNLLREAIIQTYLFDGYPTALEGLFLMAEVYDDDFSPGDNEIINENTIEKWMKRGKETCKKIYASNYDRLIKNVESLSPDLANWMLIEGYGKVLSRSELNLQYRELINVAILTVKKYQRQLHSHFKGALNVKVTKSEIEEVLKLLKPITPENVKSALELLAKIC